MSNDALEALVIATMIFTSTAALIKTAVTIWLIARTKHDGD